MNFKVIFILMLMCYLSKPDPSNNINDLYKDYLFLSTTQEYYKLHPSNTWIEAQKICENETSILWYPSNYDEAPAVTNLVGGGASNLWINVGLTDADVEGSFKTLDGIFVSEVYHRWASNQPDNAGNEDCVQLYHAVGINDVPCTFAAPFICKKTKKSWQKWNEECGERSLDTNKINDYRILNTTHDYYKIHSPTSWTEAQKICDSEDSILWHPKNKVEAQAVMCLIRPERPIHVGLTDAESEGTFKTVDGVSVENVYNKWNKNEPDNFGDQDCVQINTAYGLNDISCSVIHPYICKKAKKSEVVQWNAHCNISGLDIMSKSHNTLMRKGYEYIEAFKAFYKYHITSQTWSDAKKICESDGAKLFYPKNHNEMHDVLSYCKQKDLFYCMFIGVSDLFIKGIYETVDGHLLDDLYNEWQTGEPNQLNCSENCITVNDKGQLNDDSCSRKYPFVCKYLVTTSTWNKKCNMSNLDYTYNVEEGKCYKVHKKALSWTEAYGVCRSEQSYLAVINSKRERNHLLSLTIESPEQVTRVLPKGTIHLGFHNRFGKGWFTIRGTTLDDSGYAHWDVDQSRGVDQGNEERCGSMTYAGRLRNVTCDTKSIFICEHDLDI